MRKTLLALIGIALVLIGGVACKGGSSEKAKRQADSVQRAKKLADSLAAARADSMALAAEEAARLQAQQAELEAQQQQAANLKFHVIVGGFVIQSNADGYLARMQAHYPAAKIFVAPNGYKLVSIGDFATFDEALGMIRGIAREQDSEERIALWVYEEGGRYDTSDWLEHKGEDGYDAYDEGGSTSGAQPDEFDAV